MKEILRMADGAWTLSRCIKQDLYLFEIVTHQLNSLFDPSFLQRTETMAKNDGKFTIRIDSLFFILQVHIVITMPSFQYVGASVVHKKGLGSLRM